MAMRDEIRQQRKRLKGKGIKAYIKWFIDYQLVTTIVIVIAVIFVISIIYTSVTAKESVFGVMFVNAVLSDDQEEILAEDFMEYAGIDSKQYEVYMDLSETLTDEYQTTYDVYSSSIIATRIGAGQVDVMVADYEVFANYAAGEYFLNLSEVLDAETLETYSALLYYVDAALFGAEEDEETEDAQEDASGDDAEQAGEGGDADAAEDEAQEFVLPDPSAMEDPVPVGIVVTDAPYIAENGNYTDACVLGFLASTEAEDYCTLFLEYLFENE